MDLKTSLDDLETAVRERYPKNAARLEQLEFHLATVRMILDHLEDEAVRHGEGS